MKFTAEENEKKYPKGYFINLWMGLGIAIFSGIGVPLAIITESFAFIGIGPAIGVSVGLAIGQGLENKYEKEGKMRELTPTEKRRSRRLLLGAFVILSLLLLAGLIFFFRMN